MNLEEIKIIVGAILVFIIIIVFCIVRADKKVSPEKYKKEEPNYQNEDGIACCPKCKSTQIQVVARKWSPLTGILTNEVDRVCINCKHKF